MPAATPINSPTQIFMSVSSRDQCSTRTFQNAAGS
jgi:hypothetical protein